MKAKIFVIFTITILLLVSLMARELEAAENNADRSCEENGIYMISHDCKTKENRENFFPALSEKEMIERGAIYDKDGSLIMPPYPYDGSNVENVQEQDILIKDSSNFLQVSNANISPYNRISLLKA